MITENPSKVSNVDEKSTTNAETTEVYPQTTIDNSDPPESKGVGIYLWFNKLIPVLCKEYSLFSSNLSMII